MSLTKTIRKKHHYGKTLRRYERKHPVEARQQLNPIRPAFIRNGSKLTKEPMLTLGMFFMKTCEFGAGWIGAVSASVFA